MTPTTSPYLPRFSDPGDIDEFVDTLGRFERGELSAEDFRRYRLTRGVYGQRQTDVQMLRVKIPQGVLAPPALEALADVAERFGHGHGSVTTRQNVQFHFVQMADAETAMRRLDEAGLTTREACGNTVRTVTADPLAGVRNHGTFDVTPYGEAITRFFLRSPWANSLPRKFKIALGYEPGDTIMAGIHDIGLIARVRDGQRGFLMRVAGGLSTSPQAAIVFQEFLPEARLLDACEAVNRVFDRTGNRDNKHRARLKYVLRKMGQEKFLQVLNEEYAAVLARGGTPLDLSVTTAPPVPPPPSVTDDAPATRGPGYLLWRASNTVAQDQPGYHAVIVRLALGAVTTAQFRALAKLITEFADGSLRTSIDQNLVLRWVPTHRLPALHAALDAVGLAKPGARTVADVTTCPGAESCNLAVTASRQVGAAITARLESDASLAAAVKEASATVIKVSGCPNSCGQHHIADIGWHGAARKVGERTAPVYQLHLGGGFDEEGARFGRQIVKIPARRVDEAVARLVALYSSDRSEGETATAFYKRVPAARVHAVLDDLAALDATTPDEVFLDINESMGFRVAIGEGECAA
ncbi:MAG: nitrite/sulfite reductase [Deltaproteobacteria bacterium]|nr:nitrite/sulfite reductase [Myxococcales bacterium]MDP3219665.1 nitrite/sulfite reductase [Deltaproteobacteria bacterium]